MRDSSSVQKLDSSIQKEAVTCFRGIHLAEQEGATISQMHEVVGHATTEVEKSEEPPGGDREVGGHSFRRFAQLAAECGG